VKSLLDKLRKKKDVAADYSEPAQASEKKAPAGLSVQRLILFGLAAVLIVVAVLATANYLQMLVVAKGQQEAAATNQAARAADQLAARVQGYTDILTAAAHMPAVISAMESGDRAALAQQSAALGHIFPGATRVRFIAKGESQVDDSTTPILSYACLDLARRAETATTPPPVEVHLLGTKDQHLGMVRAVTGTQGVVGSLLVSFDVDMLKLWLRPLLASNGGYIELRQGSDDNYLLLAATGDAALKAQQTPYTVPVAGSSWQIAYWPSAAATSFSTGQLVAFFGSYGIAIAALVVVFVGLATIVSRIVRNDLITVVKQAIDIWSGKRQHSYDVRLAESIEILVALEQRVQSAQPQTPPQIHPDPVKAAAMQQSGIVVDEVPDEEQLPPPSVLFMDKGAMEVEEMSPPPLYSRDDEDGGDKKKE